MESVYDLYRRGMALLEAGDHHAAAVALERARDRAPEKTSIREGLGRAFFHSARYEEARTEFEAVVEHAPTNDYLYRVRAALATARAA
jgi:thioredoxin-like negative regulator of GroEL